MRLRGRMFVATLLLALAAVAPAAAGGEKSKSRSPRSDAKIGMKEARAKALARVPGGRVKSSELERENGKLVYSFDIRPAKGAGIEEVQIDAVTGEVVSVEHETPAKEKAEKRGERKETKQNKR